MNEAIDSENAGGYQVSSRPDFPNEKRDLRSAIDRRAVDEREYHAEPIRGCEGPRCTLADRASP